MSATYKVRFGVSAARELEFDVVDVGALKDAYEKAVKKGEAVLWVTDSRGHEYGIAVPSIAFIEFAEPQVRGVGFGS